jgi:hypothetical protein
MVRTASVAAAILCAAIPPAAHAADEALELAGPLPANYQELIENYLKAHLRDPFSAVVEVTRPPRLAVYYANRTIWGPGKGYANWIVCFNLNAKNALGGFVGFRPYALFIRNGVISNHGNGEYGKFTPITGDSDALKECSLGKEGKP